MKKLMCAVAAVAAGVCCGVESSNIVGYGQSQLQQYGITAGASFVPITGNTIDLTDLVGKGYESEGYCEGWITVQTLNEYGQTVESYQWMDSGEGPTGEWYGWYPEGSEEKVVTGTVEVQPGEGLWVYCTMDGLSIQSAGAVETTTDTIVTLQLYGLSVANPNPVTVDLTDTYATGYESEGYCEGWVAVQTLNEYGQTLQSYLWMDSGDGDWFGWYPEGSEEKVTPNTVTVNAGQGLWTYCSVEGLYFNWPKVDL